MTVPEGTVALVQEDTSIVPAGRSTRVLQRLATLAGARLHDESPVESLVAHDDGTVTVTTSGRTAATFRARHVVLTADAWTNQLLAHLDTSMPLTVTREQVTYFAPSRPARYSAASVPVWIWMDDPSFYGFPTYDEGGMGSLVKAGQDVGGAVTTADSRTFAPDVEGEHRLTRFVHRRSCTGCFPGRAHRRARSPASTP
jgi:sarcosine oxidase